MINIKGLDKTKILRALYNNAKPFGFGFLHFEKEDMTIKEAESYLKKSYCFDYLKGRFLKVNLKDDELDPVSFDRDYGRGSCEQIINSLR